MCSLTHWVKSVNSGLPLGTGESRHLAPRESLIRGLTTEKRRVKRFPSCPNHKILSTTLYYQIQRIVYGVWALTLGIRKPVAVLPSGSSVIGRGCSRSS